MPRGKPVKTREQRLVEEMQTQLGTTVRRMTAKLSELKRKKQPVAGVQQTLQVAFKELGNGLSSLAKLAPKPATAKTSARGPKRATKQPRKAAKRKG